MKKILFFITLFAYGLNAQEAHVLFNRVNMSIYNPAFTVNQETSILLFSRSQWTNIKDAPRANYILYNLPEKKNVNIGFTVQNDRVFIEQKTNLTVDYNYKVKISETDNLFLGIKGGGFYNKINLDQLERLTSMANPALAPIKNYFTPVLGIGMQYKAPNYFLGVGMPSLFNNKRYKDTRDWETYAADQTYIYLSGGAFLSLNRNFNLIPVITYRAISDNPNLFSMNFEIEYKERFSFGYGVSNNSFGGIFITSKGIKGIELGYGYEFINSKKVKAIRSGSHELMLRFLLTSKKDKSIIREEGINEK